MCTIRMMVLDSVVGLIDACTAHAVSIGALFDDYGCQEIDSLFECVLEHFQCFDRELEFEFFYDGIYSAWLIRTVFGLPTPHYQICGIKTAAMRARDLHKAFRILFRDANEPLIDSVLDAIKHIETTLSPFSDSDEIAKSICKSRVNDINSWFSLARDIEKLHTRISDYNSLCTLPLYDQFLATYITDVAKHLITIECAARDSKLFEKMQFIAGVDTE